MTYGIFEYEEQEIRGMMGEGEDNEEFALRLLKEHAKPKPNFGNKAGDLLLMFGWYRREFLDGHIDRLAYDSLVWGVVEDALKLTGGPVEPSTEYVGYF